VSVRLAPLLILMGLASISMNVLWKMSVLTMQIVKIPMGVTNVIARKDILEMGSPVNLTALVVESVQIMLHAKKIKKANILAFVMMDLS